jgi:NADP-dependent 3-hydroxy acid dehydrogenase YdfG
MSTIKGVLYGIAVALPVFRKQGFGHFHQHGFYRWTDCEADDVGLFGHEVRRASHLRGLRQEAGEKLRVTIITPGFVKTNLSVRLRRVSS